MTPWAVAYQAPPSIGFSRQEYWSGLPFPFPGDLPVPETNPHVLHCRQTVEPLVKMQGHGQLKETKSDILKMLLSHHETDWNSVELLYTHFPV